MPLTNLYLYFYDPEKNGQQEPFYISEALKQKHSSPLDDVWP